MKAILICLEILRGKDLYRIFMNEECSHHSMRGKVLDVGSGLTLASYHRFLKKEPGTTVSCLDLGFEAGKDMGAHIDLEKDSLPQEDASVDTVLLFNVLEHIYNDVPILEDIRRVLKSGGQVLGVVPFLVGYHPDPHDYWRYTVEALRKVLMARGFSDCSIQPFGLGPITAAWSQVEAVVPRLFKIVITPFVFWFDRFIITFRPKMNKEKFPLGIFFKAKK